MANSYLLQEDGGKLLQEDGGRIILDVPTPNGMTLMRLNSDEYVVPMEDQRVL